MQALAFKTSFLQAQMFYSVIVLLWHTIQVTNSWYLDLISPLHNNYMANDSDPAVPRIAKS